MTRSATTLISALCIAASLLFGGCAPAVTPQDSPPPPETSAPDLSSASNPADERLSLEQAEEQAGFDLQTPAYLPQGVTFDFASAQKSPTPLVILHYKMIHVEYGDMGAFLQILQEYQKEAPPDVTSCVNGAQGCEVISVNDGPVVYQLNPGGTEGLSWHADGITFRLLRTAGEPNKVYKDELVRLVESME